MYVTKQEKQNIATISEYLGLDADGEVKVSGVRRAKSGNIMIQFRKRRHATEVALSPTGQLVHCTPDYRELFGESPLEPKPGLARIFRDGGLLEAAKKTSPSQQKEEPVKRPPIVLDEEKFAEIEKACADISEIPKVKPGYLGILDGISLSFEDGEVYMTVHPKPNIPYNVNTGKIKVERKATLRGCIGAVGDAINSLATPGFSGKKQEIISECLEALHAEYRRRNPEGLFATDAAIAATNKEAVRRALHFGEYDNEYEKLCVVTGLEKIHQESGYWPDIYDFSFIASRPHPTFSCRLYYDIYVKYSWKDKKIELPNGVIDTVISWERNHLGQLENYSRICEMVEALQTPEVGLCVKPPTQDRVQVVSSESGKILILDVRYPEEDRKKLEQWVAKLHDEYEHREDLNTKAMIDDFYGDLVYLAILETIAANSGDEMTDNGISKNLRGLSTTQGGAKTRFYGKMNAVPSDEITSKVWKLVSRGYLETEWHRGDWSDFETVSMTDEGRALYELIKDDKRVAEEARRIGFEVSGDTPTISAMREYIADGSGDADGIVEVLANSPAILCVEPELVREFLDKVPDKCREFIKLSYKLEDDRRRKAHLKKLMELFDEKMIAKKQREEEKKAAKAAAAAPAKKKHDPFEKVKITHDGPRDDRGNLRWVVRDKDSGKVLDNANGYGYKTRQKAEAAWRYKNRSPEAKKADEDARKWLRSNRQFSRWMEDEAFYCLKDSGGHESLTAGRVREMLADEGVDIESLPFTAQTLLRVWSHS